MLFLSLYFLQCALTCTRDGLDAAQIVLFDQKHSNWLFFFHWLHVKKQRQQEGWWQCFCAGQGWEISTSCVGHSCESTLHAWSHTSSYSWPRRVMLLSARRDWGKPQTLKWTSILAACAFDCVSCPPARHACDSTVSSHPQGTNNYISHTLGLLLRLGISLALRLI